MIRPRFWRTPRGMARLVLVGLIVTYVGLLKWAYITQLVPVFGYTGLRYVPAGVGGECLSWLFALVPTVWLPLDIDRPSRLPLWFQYLVVYIPTSTIPLYNVAPGDRSVWPLVAAVLGALMIVQALTALRRLDIGTLRITPAAFRTLLLGLAAVLLVPIVMTFGVPTHVPTLAEVYDVRSDYNDVLATAPVVAAYAVVWFGRIVAPLLLIEGVLNRRWILALLGFLGAAFIFSLSGMKSIALSGFFVVGLRMLYRPGGRRMGVWLAAGVTGVIVISIVANVVSGTVVFSSLFIRRALVVPGLLSGYFYQFFSTHPLTYLGSSFLRPLAGYPYDASPQLLIGAVYFGLPPTHANVNVWGDAFANFGLVGIIAFAVVLGLILWVFDGLAARRSAAMTCLMLAIPSLMLTNSALPIAILSNGLALTFVIAAFLPADPARAQRAGPPRGTRFWHRPGIEMPPGGAHLAEGT